MNRSRALALLFAALAALALFSTSKRRPLSTPAAAVRIAAQSPPAPNARVPGKALDLARSLAGADQSLRAALRGGDQRGVTLYALYVQRALRRLARHPRLAAATAERMPPRLAHQTRDLVRALRDLSRLSAGWKPHRIVVGRAEALSALRGYYREAQRRYGVGWHILAAVNHVESAFGRLRNASVSGAQGPMQFMPSTWHAYGLGGDVHDAHDAILGAAHYLQANGAPRSYASALYHYNPSPLYVDAVLRYARLMARDRDALPALYAWQVFVRTRDGERRITGPTT